MELQLKSCGNSNNSKTTLTGVRSVYT